MLRPVRARATAAVLASATALAAGLAATAPASALAALPSKTVGHLTYEAISSNPSDGMQVVDFDDQIEHVTVRSHITIDGVTWRVKRIGYEAFRNSDLVELELPNTIRGFGERAFRGSELDELVLPNSVRFIGSEAFSGNNLEKVVIPAGVTHVGESAFANMPSLFALRFKGLPSFDDPSSIAGASTLIRYESAADVSLDENGFSRDSWKIFNSVVFPKVVVKAKGTVKDNSPVTVTIRVRVGSEQIDTGRVRVTFAGQTKTFNVNAPSSKRTFKSPNVSGKTKTYTAKAVYLGDSDDNILKNTGRKKIKVKE